MPMPLDKAGMDIALLEGLKGKLEFIGE